MENNGDEIKVLLVEDAPDFAEMYKLKLELDGYLVKVARDGEAALHMLQNETHPDLMFLDIRLPKLDGISLLRKLRDDPNLANLPVVILSNYGQDELIQQGLQLGALEYLIKADVTPAQISQNVERWSTPLGSASGSSTKS